MIVKSLDTISFDTLIVCFLEAFANYYVPMPADKNYYKQRWQAAKVDYSLSFGMFDKDKLVGFIIHAVAQREERHIAFNTGTGVIPSYRGRGIVKRIYDYALSILKNRGVTHSVLEVISENERAINAYKNVGFRICKNYPCFKGTLEKSINEAVSLKKVRYQDFDWAHLPNQQVYSWDNHYTIIKNADYSYYQLLSNAILKGYVVIKPETGYIAQLDVFDNDAITWNVLLEGISKISREVRMINVDDRLTTKIEALKLAGLENYVSQFEMDMEL